MACFVGCRAGSTSGSLGSRIQECAAATDLGLDVFLVVSWSFTVCVKPFAQKLPLFILRPLVASGLFLGGTYGGKGVYTTCAAASEYRSTTGHMESDESRVRPYGWSILLRSDVLDPLYR